MERDQEFISEANIPANNPQFLQQIYSLLAKSRKATLQKNEPLKKIILEEYNNVSLRADRSKVQDSCSIRNVLKCRDLAKFLIDDEGNLNKPLLDESIKLLRQNLYPLGPQRQYDGERQEHILHSLELLQKNQEIQRLLKSIQKPQGLRNADAVIRNTLALAEKTPVTDAHARQAALAAWLCFLRQSVGSCFATAPAIIVHNEQPEQFFRDLNDLLSVGQIKRTFEGMEYSVPFSPSWGAGDLKRTLIFDGEETELWLSPGVLSALEAVGLIDASQPLTDRIKETKKLVLNFLKQKEKPVYTSVEEILKYSLMNQLKLTDEDLIQYNNRRNMLGAGGLIQVSSSSGGSKTNSCKQFYERESIAHDAFKSIADNALLKTWEFTLASFAETKPAFTRWNLYASLGFQHDQPGGVGECLYTVLKEKLEEQNREVHHYNEQYEQMYPYIRYLETRVRTAATEEEIRWLKADYNMKLIEFRNLEEQRNKANYRAQWFANAYDVILHYYDKLFPQYFQEIYDAAMHDVGANPYDDSPAGFRLLYKSGRANTSQWNLIYSPAEFIEALASFFLASERELEHYPEFKDWEKELSELTTAVIKHVRTEKFLETAFDRMAAAHGTARVKNPLENLDKIEKKPWVYTSGGSLENLVKCYWRREEKPKEEARWVESQTELFVFLVDTIKHQPEQILDLYRNDPKKSMIIHSPTHAFLLKPGAEEFKQAWEAKEFTYTWVRDQQILPRDRFVDRIKLDQDKMQFLIEIMSNQLASHYRHYFRRTFAHTWGVTTPSGFRREIAETMQKERGLQYQGRTVLPLEELDCILYESLPITELKDLDPYIHEIIPSLPGLEQVSKEQLQDIIDAIKNTLIGFTQISAKQLLDILIAITLIIRKEMFYPYDYYELIVEAARKRGLLMPQPILFADTNWVRDKFAFLVSPGTGKLELWRTDLYGSTGSPMLSWEQWLNGSRKDRQWGVYTHPFEYVSRIKKPFEK